MNGKKGKREKNIKHSFFLRFKHILPNFNKKDEANVSQYMFQKYSISNKVKISLH